MGLTGNADHLVGIQMALSLPDLPCNGILLFSERSSDIHKQNQENSFLLCESKILGTKWGGKIWLCICFLVQSGPCGGTEHRHLWRKTHKIATDKTDPRTYPNHTKLGADCVRSWATLVMNELLIHPVLMGCWDTHVHLHAYTCASALRMTTACDPHKSKGNTVDCCIEDRMELRRND